MSLGSTIVVTYTAPGDSPLVITNDVLVSSLHFSSQMATTPGQFSCIVRDPDHVYSFTTGGEFTVDVDGVRLFGGYVLNATRQFAVPADNTVTQSTEDVQTRQWSLSGSDYNYRLDKLIFRNLDNLTTGVSVDPPVSDATLITTYYPLYFDIPDGWDLSTYVVENFTWTVPYPFGGNGYGQGFSMRTALADLTQYGAVAYMGPDAALRFLPVQDTAAPWGFSDTPDGTNFIGFRDGSATEDLTATFDDVFVWGGSAITSSTTESIFVARRENTDMIAAHGRWQYAEVAIGRIKSELEVIGRANTIISGNTTGTNTEGQQGTAQPEYRYQLSWFGHTVPKSGGLPVHLYPGMVVPIELWTFSTDGGLTPYTLTVPLRSLDVSFPSLDPTGKPYVRFDGTFALNVSDPNWLWAYLRRDLDTFRSNITNGFYATATTGTTGALPYGTLWNGTTDQSPDGSTYVFTIPYGYIGGTTQVSLNGLSAALNIDYVESDPVNGEITWVSTNRTPLVTGDVLWIVCRLLG